jgi:hypothetical protein
MASAAKTVLFCPKINERDLTSATAHNTEWRMEDVAEKLTAAEKKEKLRRRRDDNQTNIYRREEGGNEEESRRKLISVGNNDVGATTKPMMTFQY